MLLNGTALTITFETLETFFKKKTDNVFSCENHREVKLMQWSQTASCATKNTVISLNFLVWKFCGKAQFPHCCMYSGRSNLHSIRKYIDFNFLDLTETVLIKVLFGISSVDAYTNT